MSMSNLAIIESEDEYVESCDFWTITSFVVVMNALLTGCFHLVCIAIGRSFSKRTNSIVSLADFFQCLH